jgi:hypothetical protein
MNKLIVILVCAAGCDVGFGSHGSESTQQQTQTAQGDVQTLRCTSGGADLFKATLDGSSYDPGSGVFDVSDATIRDNYATATLICTGHTLPEIDCIGFWFDLAEQVGEVTTANGASGLTASYVAVRGDLVFMSTPPWACTVE